MTAHLMFSRHGTRYALPAAAVRATCWLPALSPVEDLPPWVLGLMDLHGEVIPVLDLGRRLGHPDRPFGLDQAVILLEQAGLRAGLVADEVLDLAETAPDAVAPYVRLAGEPSAQAPSVIAGTLKWADGVLILIDPCALLESAAPEAPALVPYEPAERAAGLSAPECERLKQRTHRLALPPVQAEAAQRLYALVQIGAGRYAIALEQVSEFARLGTFTPIPCCPPQIIGCINLRGVILTVLDLAPLLQGTALRDYGHLAVLRLGDLRLGLAVHAIMDIRPSGAGDLSPLAGPGFGHPYCKWVLQYDGGPAGVLDLQALLAQGVLDVDDRI